MKWSQGGGGRGWGGQMALPKRSTELETLFLKPANQYGWPQASCTPSVEPQMTAHWLTISLHFLIKTIICLEAGLDVKG
jgi:hypothetical protein